MGKLERVFSIIWILCMLFCCSLDFYVMLTDFNVWVLIGFICCGTSAVMKGVEMYLKDKDNNTSVVYGDEDE